MATVRDTAAQPGDPRAMMHAELVKLRAPLGMLTALSRCLTDRPEDLEIRNSVMALLCRAEALTERLSGDLGPRACAFDLGDHIRGST